MEINTLVGKKTMGQRKIKRKAKNILRNEKGNNILKLWKATKAVLRGKYIAINVYI